MKIILRVFTVLLLLFLGFGGVYGAFMLLADTSGGNFLWSPELLEGTPFNDFLIPGIVLLIVNGLLPIFVAVLTIANTKNFPWWVIVQGILLIGWLTAEILFSRDLFSPQMHYPSYSVAILLILIGLILSKKQK